MTTHPSPPVAVPPSNDPRLLSQIVLLKKLPKWIKSHAQLRDAALRQHDDLLDRHKLNPEQARQAILHTLNDLRKQNLEMMPRLSLANAVHCCRAFLVRQFQKQVRQEDLAEELADRAIVKATDAILRLKNKIRTSLLAWLTKVATTSFGDYDRKEKGRIVERPHDPAAVGAEQERPRSRPQREHAIDLNRVADPHDDIQAKDSELDLEEAITELATEQQARVLELRLDGLGTGEIAKVLKISRRGVQRVLEHLEELISDRLGFSPRNLA